MKLTEEQKDWQKRCPSHLKPKIEYSISLLRKAEKLALAYDSEDGYFLAFSGGKDSQVLYHIAELAGVKFKAHMNFTSVDPPQVVRFVRKQYPEVVTHAPKRSIYAAAVDRMILPTMRVRWCCAEFKEAAGAGKVTLIGIRKQESSRRAKRNEVEINSRKFSGTLEDLDTYREKKVAKTHDEHEQISIVNAKGERTLGCINSKESLLISPLLSWTDADVWTFLNDVVMVPHCELYDMGFSRVGCVLCPMSSRKVKAKMAQLYPEAKHRWIEAIKEIRRLAGGGYNKHSNALEQNDGEQSDQQKKRGKTFKDGYLWWNMPANPLKGRMQKGRKMHKQQSHPQRPSNAVHLPSLAQQPRQLGFQTALLQVA